MSPLVTGDAPEPGWRGLRVVQGWLDPTALLASVSQGTGGATRYISLAVLS